MVSLILTIFFVHVAIYLVNTVGASTIDTLVCSYLVLAPARCQFATAPERAINDANQRVLQLWILYLKLPTSTSKNAREQSRLKREVVQLKREMNNTSSQDEFAKWAKLRRKHDKAMDEYEAMSAYPTLCTLK
jgi:hypothetical protein